MTTAPLKHGDRIRNRETGQTGKFLRIEHYPKRGKLATVKWDSAMFARPVDPKLLERI